MSRFLLIIFLISMFYGIGIVSGLSLNNDEDDIQLPNIETTTVELSNIDNEEKVIESIESVSKIEQHPIEKAASFFERIVLYINEFIVMILYKIANLFF